MTQELIERLRDYRVKEKPLRDEAADALQSQSARIAELEDLPRLIELQRTAAPDCDREEGWNAGLDRAADIARSSLSPRTQPVGKLMEGFKPHDWRCDCEWCWLGVTNTPQPPSLFKRIVARLRSQSTPDILRSEK